MSLTELLEDLRNAPQGDDRVQAPTVDLQAVVKALDHQAAALSKTSEEVEHLTRHLCELASVVEDLVFALRDLQDLK